MTRQESRFGTLLVRDSIITQTQLNHALQTQKEQEERQRLGEVLVELGYVTRRKLRSAIRRFGKRAMFGEVLVEDGTITRAQLEQVLREQKIRGGAVGQLLIKKGVLDEDQLAQALSQQLDIPYMIPQPKLVDMNLFGRLPERFIKLHSVIPVFETEGVVTVLAADPTDLRVVYQLEDTFGRDIELATCSKWRIDNAIESLLRQKKFGAETKRAEAIDQGRTRLGQRLVIEGDSAGYGKGESLAAGILDYLIYSALEERASDVHIEPQRDRVRTRYRVDGVLLFRTEFPLSLARPLVVRAKALANLDIGSTQRQQEGRILARVDGREIDLRVTICQSVFGESMAIRVFSKDTGLMDVADLGMDPAVVSRCQRLIEQSSGFTLFVGPTGTGKTTSLYAALNHLNDGSRKTIAIEAPVEFPMDGIVQRNLPANDEAEVTQALMGALHQDPDVIALGEMTTDRTAAALLESSLMGHKVFSTQHAEDGASALVRLAHVPGAGSLLNSCSLTIMAQRLVRKVCANCAAVHVPPLEILERLQMRGFDPDTVDFRMGEGCPECLGTGYRGRTGIFEMLEVGPDMRESLLGRPSGREIRQMALNSPQFISLKQAGFLKAVQGITTLEEVVRVAPAVQLTVPEGQQPTLEELYRRAGLSFEGSMERHDHDMVGTPAEEES